jgi:hypothetical protein
MVIYFLFFKINIYIAIDQEDKLLDDHKEVNTTKLPIKKRDDNV